MYWLFKYFNLRLLTGIRISSLVILCSFLHFRFNIHLSCLLKTFRTFQVRIRHVRKEILRGGVPVKSPRLGAREFVRKFPLNFFFGVATGIFPLISNNLFHKLLKTILSDLVPELQYIMEYWFIFVILFACLRSSLCGFFSRMFENFSLS